MLDERGATGEQSETDTSLLVFSNNADRNRNTHKNTVKRAVFLKCQQ